MKTFQEVQQHLSETMYDNESKNMILGYLLGNRFFETAAKEGEVNTIDFAETPYICNFEDFAAWFEDETPNEENTPVPMSNTDTIAKQCEEAKMKLLEEIEENKAALLESNVPKEIASPLSHLLEILSNAVKNA